MCQSFDEKKTLGASGVAIEFRGTPIPAADFAAAEKIYLEMTAGCKPEKWGLMRSGIIMHHIPVRGHLYDPPSMRLPLTVPRQHFYHQAGSASGKHRGLSGRI